jgi:hypothetical protein
MKSPYLILLLVVIIAACLTGCGTKATYCDPDLAEVRTRYGVDQQPAGRSVSATQLPKTPSSEASPQEVASEKHDEAVACKACGSPVVPMQGWFLETGLSPVYWVGYYCPNRPRLTIPAEMGDLRPQLSSVFGFIAGDKLYLARFRSQAVRKVVLHGKRERVRVWTLAGKPVRIQDWKPGDAEDQAIMDFHNEHEHGR